VTARFIACYDKPADPEAFDRHYHEVHIPIARQLPGLRRYTVSQDTAEVRGEAYYLVAELDWDSMAELRAAFGSPQGRATAEDAAHLEKLAPVRSMVCTVRECLT